MLDDFCNENWHQWEKLIRPLHKGAPGSVIIVTAGTRLVAGMVSSTLSPYHLKKLSECDCYSLVKQYASCNDEHACAKLHTMRSEIFRKYRGMPEEAISLGDQLHRERDREK